MLENLSYVFKFNLVKLETYFELGFLAEPL